MTTIAVPDETEYAPYYLTYVSKVPAGDVRQLLEKQARDAKAVFSAISDERSLHRYAPGKWSIREMIHHVNDAERVFTHRALWFARGLGPELPSYDQDIAATVANANATPWPAIVEEYGAIRAASLALFRSLPDDAWERRGVASGNPVTVRALAYIVCGHTAHHLQILKERYL